MRIVSIDKQVQDGDYSKWRVVFEHEGKEVSHLLCYGGMGEALDAQDKGCNFLAREASLCLFNVMREMFHADSLRMADEIVNRVLQDKGKRLR